MRVKHASILKASSLSLAFVLVATLYSSINTFAQSAEFNPRSLGTTDAGFPIRHAPANIGPVNPFLVVSKAQYSSGGVALRNRGTGAIHVSGVIAPVKVAYIYWSVLVNAAGVIPAETSVTLQRLFPPPVAGPVVLPGVLLKVGADPCWGSAGAAVFRAPVPIAVANGNGLYQITLNAGASGLTNGADPWVGAPVFPLFEGASLVIVGTGTGNVAIYDVPLAGTEFDLANPLNYALTLPAAATGTLTLWDNIGDDGQIGTSRTAVPGVSLETTTINAVAISGGAGALDNDSDWNGSSGFPLPQLWDDTGHDITKATPAGTAVLNVAFAANGDCLNAIANVVEVH
jgi:hypothetical protein